MNDPHNRPDIETRRYGAVGPQLLLLHGGPGAPGSIAPVARELADGFRVLEPLQRGSGEKPLTVATHIEDIDSVIGRYCNKRAPAIVGHSWGAMLALAYAAAYPEHAGPVVLIGCGTFDPVARSEMCKTIDERMSPETKRELESMPDKIPDPDARLNAMGRLLEPAYSCEPITEGEGEPCDARAYEETWTDMLQLQESGAYPAAFVAIQTPVLMLHGAEDPHPGSMIRDSLLPSVPQLEYVELACCGHYPWREAAAREPFYATLRQWLKSKLAV